MSHQDFADHCILGLTHVAQQSLREKLRLLPPAPSADLLPPAHLCEVPPPPPPPMYAANHPLLLDYPSADAPHPDWLLPYAAASRYQDLQFPHLYPLDVPPQLLHHHPSFPNPLGQGAACEPSATQGLTLSLASTLPHEPLGLLSELVPSAAKHCAIGPLGPFTGYATILQNSKFLRPAQQLLDECCTPATSLLHPNKPPGLTAFGRGLASDAAASSSRCSFEGVGDSGGLHRHEIQERKAKLLVLQGEVCRRYKQYNQQIQMAISSFESVAGLSGAIPFMSAAVKTVSRHFRFLKHVISEQVLQISRALGEEISSYPSLSNSERATSSRSKFLEQTLRRQKAEENGLVAMENSQPIWRPQRGLPERAVAVLRAWLFDHFLHPYPTDTDKLMLAQQTGLSRNQVSNWFINARVRVWKPMVEEIHMLETKGSAEKDLSSSTRNEASQRSVADQDHEVQPDQQSGNFSHLSQVEPSQLESNPHCQSIGQWPMEKQRLGMEGCSSGADVTGQFADLSAYHGGIQMGGLGSVSLTLGLRQDDGAWQQQYQQMRPYFGSQMIND